MPLIVADAVGVGLDVDDTGGGRGGVPVGWSSVRRAACRAAVADRVPIGL